MINEPINKLASSVINIIFKHLTSTTGGSAKERQLNSIQTISLSVCQLHCKYKAHSINKIKKNVGRPVFGIDLYDSFHCKAKLQ